MPLSVEELEKTKNAFYKPEAKPYGTFQAMRRNPSANQALLSAIGDHLPGLMEDEEENTPSISKERLKKKLHPFWEPSADDEDPQNQGDVISFKKENFLKADPYTLIIQKPDGHIITVKGRGPNARVSIQYPEKVIQAGTTKSDPLTIRPFTTQGAFLLAQAKAATANPRQGTDEDYAQKNQLGEIVRYNIRDWTSQKHNRYSIDASTYKENVDTMVLASLIEAQKARVQPDINVVRYYQITNRARPINEKYLDNLDKAAIDNVVRYLARQDVSPEKTEEARKEVEAAINYGKKSIRLCNSYGMLKAASREKGLSKDVPTAPFTSTTPDLKSSAMHNSRTAQPAIARQL